MSEKDIPASKQRTGIKRPSSRPSLKTVFRITVAILVAVAVIYTAIKSTKQLSESNIDFRQVQFVWWAAALGIYLLTMFLSLVFWHRVLLALDQSPKFGDSMLAFFASQLGKYIPGKAMVVVIRTDMIRGDNVKTAPAAASVFVETLTWVFVGSVIGCLLLVTEFRDQVGLQIGAAILALIAGVLTWPPVFRKIAGRLSPVSEKRAAKMFGGLNLKTMTFGWLVLALGWCLNGFSLWMVLKGIPGTEVVTSDFPLALACVTLATVAGFVSLLPGGIGVRELVMIPLLGARFGPVTAVVAAVVIRLVWLAAELSSAGFTWLVRRLR